MQLIPAIDLRNGGCVRLRQGDFEQQTSYDADPTALAREYQAAGAEILHVVDLDGAKAGSPAQVELVGQMARAIDIPVQTGGGVRTLDDIQHLLDAGASRVVVGTVAVRDPDTAGRWLKQVGADRMVVAMDLHRDADGGWMPAVAGWTEAGEHGLDFVLDSMRGYGLKHLLCTDISRDGMLTGPNRELYRELAGHPGLQVQASGGVGTLEHLDGLKDSGVTGVIVGKALLDGRFTVQQALEVLA
ncbi:MAG: 1-(5-phosphoribosyl)-5-[(5-phosphoribosylamino)methylideneamino]imidazole-4-carboxamide isomerase [Xanthomonadales bacterium]|nr:1-(5-phosphoribosyl)-5-[(5-phosphoribosylamino)methylideneamino]imidazole-4-carboxamide isomerase [Xanthomonadales bacterium]